MARTPGATSEQTDQRIAEAVELLQRGISRAGVVRHLANTHSVHVTSARRWVNAACCDVHDCAGQSVNLETGMLNIIEKLERISDHFEEQGDPKEQVRALKAAAQLYNQRLTSIERTAIQAKKLSSSLPF